MEKEDKKLYEKFINGNEEAFEELVKKYKNNILYYIFGIINNKETAEDLCQDVFLYIYDKKEKYNSNYSFKGYLYLIAKSKSIDYLRKEKVKNDYFEKNSVTEIENVLLEDVIFENKIDENILKVLNSLKSEYREVIYLSILEDLSYKEISKIMNKDISQVKNLVHRAKIKLKKQLVENKVIEEKDFRIIKIFTFVIVGIIMVSGIGYCTYQFINNVLIKPRDNSNIGIEFSDKFNEYSKKYDEISSVDENTEYSENNVKLISSFINEAFLTLEFEVDITKETYEELRIGESVLTDEDIEYMRKSYGGTITEEEKEKVIQERIETAPKNNVKLEINSNNTVVGDNTLIIDGQKIFIKGIYSESNELNKYTYQVYLIVPIMRNRYFLDKDEFKLTIEHLNITNGSDITQQQHSESGFYLISGGVNKKLISVDKKFEIELSKIESKKDLKIINCDKNVALRNYSKSIEEVAISPTQTIIKVDTIVKNVSSKMLNSAFVKDEEKFGILYYEIFDENGNKLNCYISEVNRHIKYKNGKEEDIEEGELFGSVTNFSDAIITLKDYIVIKTDENINKIIVKPYRTLESSNNKDREYFDDIVIDINAQ